ncbi:cysteine peptidase family C39 domain-containing protein, partial [Variovorax sp. N23]|uniref:cysteine peptidase family C39 domain-containing protein n=1 Tax=Variovorax sp. N23 TaxID=2980555 RepID=UPI0021C6B4AB
MTGVVAGTAVAAAFSGPEGESEAAQRVSAMAPLAALCTIARFHHVAADPATLAHQLGLSPSDTNDTIDTATLLRAARQLGLNAKRSATDLKRLALAPLPALAVLRADDGHERFVVLAQCDAQRVLLQ